MSTAFSQTSRAEMALHLVKIELEGEIVQSQSWYFSPQAGESLDNIYSVLEKKTTNHTFEVLLAALVLSKHPLTTIFFSLRAADKV